MYLWLRYHIFPFLIVETLGSHNVVSVAPMSDLYCHSSYYDHHVETSLLCILQVIKLNFARGQIQFKYRTHALTVSIYGLMVHPIRVSSPLLFSLADGRLIGSHHIAAFSAFLDVIIRQTAPAKGTTWKEEDPDQQSHPECGPSFRLFSRPRDLFMVRLNTIQ